MSSLTEPPLLVLSPTLTYTLRKVLDFGPQALSSLSRSLRAALGLLYGTWYLPLPRPCPIYMLVGKPIAVPKMDREDPQVEFKGGEGENLVSTMEKDEAGVIWHGHYLL